MLAVLVILLDVTESLGTTTKSLMKSVLDVSDLLPPIYFCPKYCGEAAALLAAV